MRSLTHQFLKRYQLTSEQMPTITLLAESRGRQQLYTQQAPEILETLQQTAQVESVESSNRLEGISAPKERLKALVLKSSAPKNRSEQEISGYRDALNLIHESYEHMPFSTNVILQLHDMVYRYLPSKGGKWKSADNEIVERDAKGNIVRVRFKCVSALHTPGSMLDLTNAHKAAIDDNVEPLMLIPLTILDFLCIHPFLDGNGRVGRLLTLMLLYQSNFMVGRYISLERIFEESKESYYETLEASSTGWHEGQHDVKPWLDYFWGVLVRATKEFEERFRTVRHGRGSKTDFVRQAVERRIKPFAISDIENDCPGVSRDMVRVVLRQLKAEGRIELQGKGRGAKWLRKPS